MTPEQVIRRYWEAESRRDVAEVLTHFAPDAVLNVPEFGDLSGHEAIRTFYEASAARFAQLSVTVTSSLCNGAHGAFEWSSIFVDHAGTSYSLCGVNVIEVADRMFQIVHVYYDPTRLYPREA